MIGSETSSAYSDRGVYFTSSTVKCVSAYDLNWPGWGNSAEDSMRAIWTNDYMAGSFTWTGFDYKGEPTPYDWPNINSHFGIIDIAGFPKDAFYYYQAIWKPDVPMVHLFPHWNWNSGDKVDVWVYTNTEKVQLLLNQQDLGSKVVPKSVTPMGRVWRSHVEWSVPFSQGNLTALGFDKNGAVVAMDSRITVSQAVSLYCFVEFPSEGRLKANGVDAALVACRIYDSHSNIVPTASNVVQFTVSGPGKIIGLGNGDSNSHEPDYPTSAQSGKRSAFNGLVRLVLQSAKSSGQITVLTQSDGLQSHKLSIDVN